MYLYIIIFIVIIINRLINAVCPRKHVNTVKVFCMEMFIEHFTEGLSGDGALYQSTLGVSLNLCPVVLSTLCRVYQNDSHVTGGRNGGYCMFIVLRKLELSHGAQDCRKRINQRMKRCVWK